jgi:hypothetical protein
VTLEFIGGHVWSAISKVCTGPGRRTAAIAFLGWDAPRLMPLRRGDVLVVNASDSALLAHATSPDALDAYVAAGVRVSSTPRLHAKVIVTNTHAVIGSANASTHSSELDEAIIVTDDQTVIAAGRAFISGLVDATPVDEEFLTAARATWARGRSSGLPGTAESRPDPGFLPRPPYRLYLAADTEFYDPGAGEEEVFRRARGRARRAAGPAASYYVDSFRVSRDDRPFARDDVIIQVYDFNGGRWVWPPVVVFSDPLPVPRSRSVIQLVRGRVGLNAVSVDEVAHRLRVAGVGGRLDTARWVRSTPLRDALLDIWKLTALR